MQLFYCPELISNLCFLNSVESKHCVKVLRKKEGDLIHLIDGAGSFYEARITVASQKKVQFEIVKSWKDTDKGYHLHIAIAPTKSNDRYEWFLEKATEIGIDKITPIICKHSERKVIKLERFEKIVLSATKQSLKATIPQIEEAVSLLDFLKKDLDADKYMAHCSDVEKTSCKKIMAKNLVILIGPEGDFSEKEIELALENGYKSISLGASRLRTETAGIVAANTIALNHE